MTQLRDYLAALSTEIMQARVSSDMRTKEMALAYQKDELLRHFPIPYFRTPEVLLTIPIGLKGLNPPTGNGNVGSGGAVTDPNALAELIIKTTDGYYNASLTGNDRLEFFAYIVSLLQQLMLNGDFNNDYNEDFVDDISLKIAIRSEQYYQIISTRILDVTALAALIAATIQNALSSISAISLFETDIFSNSTDLQTLDPKTIITIKMKVAESGFQWVREEAEDGTITDRLILE